LRDRHINHFDHRTSNDEAQLRFNQNSYRQAQAQAVLNPSAADVEASSKASSTHSKSSNNKVSYFHFFVQFIFDSHLIQLFDLNSNRLKLIDNLFDCRFIISDHMRNFLAFRTLSKQNYSQFLFFLIQIEIKLFSSCNELRLLSLLKQ